MTATVIAFPSPQTEFDRLDERANQVIASELARAYDIGGETAAESMIHSLIWSAAKWSAAINGAAATRTNFETAGVHGYDASKVKP